MVGVLHAKDLLTYLSNKGSVEGIVLDEPHTKKVKKLWACKCGAKNCSGTMLQPKK